MKKILVIHGPNLNLLGTREPEVYGRLTLAEINDRIKRRAKKSGMEAETFQSNFEGAIVEAIQKAAGTYDYIILNAAAYTHYSIAIRDAIAAVAVPVIEVHLSNIYSREDFRSHSVLAPVVRGQISGFGAGSYIAALAVIEEEQQEE